MNDTKTSIAIPQMRAQQKLVPNGPPGIRMLQLTLSLFSVCYVCALPVCDTPAWHMHAYSRFLPFSGLPSKRPCPHHGPSRRGTRDRTNLQKWSVCVDCVRVCVSGMYVRVHVWCALQFHARSASMLECVHGYMQYIRACTPMWVHL